MTGGLLHLATFGSQDIFLTGNPQITFFKIVYRRHTNFAIESVQQFFIAQPNFGQEVLCIVDKLGDLMNKVYLEIELPKIDLAKNLACWKNTKENARAEFEEIEKFYKIVYNYISSNTNTARKLDTLFKTNNILMSEIENIMMNQNFLNELTISYNKLHDYLLSEYFSNIKELQSYSHLFGQQMKCIDIRKIFRCIVQKINKYQLLPQEKSDLLKRMELSKIINKILYNEIYDFYKKIYDVYLDKQKIYQSFMDNTHAERYKFAWVEEIGHAIIDLIEIKIGNQVIDKHTGDWMILFNKIMVTEKHQDNYS